MTVAQNADYVYKMPERLRRLDDAFQRLPIFFVTARTHERRSILNNADVHACFVEFGKKGGDRGAWIGGYVLMPDHLHVFVVIDDGRLTLSIWAKSLKNALSKTLRGHGIPPPHWQKGFFDHILRSGESCSAKWEYVRHNPIRAGLVKSWKDWRFAGEIFDLEYRNDPT
jgi:putative transposase